LKASKFVKIQGSLSLSERHFLFSMSSLPRSSTRPGRRKKQDVQTGTAQVSMEVDIPGDLAKTFNEKRGSSKKRLEKATGAKVRIEPPQIDGQYGVVAATGTKEQVYSVVKEVKAEVAKFSPAIAEELEPRFKGLTSLGNISDRRQDGALAVQKKQNRSEWNYEDMEADIKVFAPMVTFKSLVGKRKEKITKIRDDCNANISIQDPRDVKEIQRADISGSFNDAVHAARQVKDALESYDPKCDPSVKERSVNKIDLKMIKAEAECKIIGQAVGFLIGNRGKNLERMKQETNYEDLYMDQEDEDKEGCVTVYVSGYADPVLNALSQIYLSMKWWCDKRDKQNPRLDATEEQQCMTPKSHALPMDTFQNTGVETAAEMSSTTPQQHSASLLPVLADSQAVEPPPRPMYSFQERNGYVVTLQQVDGEIYKRVVHKPQQLDHGLPPGFGISDCPQQQRTSFNNGATQVVAPSPVPDLSSVPGSRPPGLY